MDQRIPLDKTTSIDCDKCGNNIFIEGLILRKASRFITGTTQDAIIPVTVFSCSKCGHVNNAFLPLGLKETESSNEDENVIKMS